jgi:hypothetical protein
VLAKKLQSRFNKFHPVGDYILSVFMENFHFGRIVHSRALSGRRRVGWFFESFIIIYRGDHKRAKDIEVSVATISYSCGCMRATEVVQGGEAD